MSETAPAILMPQGFCRLNDERLPLPPRDAMSPDQLAAERSIINGPRKAIFGPFVPLMQTPELMERVGKVGEYLRFDGCLPDRIRELVICVVARETSNQFEWQTHVPLAVNAGIKSDVLAALAEGRHPRDGAIDEQCAIDFVMELMHRQGVSDTTYAESVSLFGASGTVEITALAGYFSMACWIMNVARTPGPTNSGILGLDAFPA